MRWRRAPCPRPGPRIARRPLSRRVAPVDGSAGAGGGGGGDRAARRVDVAPPPELGRDPLDVHVSLAPETHLDLTVALSEQTGDTHRGDGTWGGRELVC